MPQQSKAITHSATAVRHILFASLLGLMAATGCDEQSQEPVSDVSDPRFATRLGTPEDFARLQGEQWAVKYLARVDGSTPPVPLARACTFQDTAAYPLHVQFLRTFSEFATLDFEAYLPLVMKRASRVLWAGELRLFAGAAHPVTGRPGVLGLFVYSDREEPLEMAELVQVYRRIAGCAPYARDALVLVGADTQQAQHFRSQAHALASFGVRVVDHADLAPQVAAEGYSIGEGYGYLRIVPRGARLPADIGLRDLLVVEGASEDIGLVAGLVTALPQNVHSHLNLRLREKAIPNARVPRIFQDQALTNLDGQLARLRVDAETAALEPASLVDAEAFWRTRVVPIILPPANLDEVRLAPIALLSTADAKAYGSKAANLGELFRILPEANRVAGFGIPFSRYQDWMRESGISERVSSLLADSRIDTDATFRRSALSELREAIEMAWVSPEWIAELLSAAEGVFGARVATLPLRFRSSSNGEDGTSSSGAGLYDSARGCFADDLDAHAEGSSACLSGEERAALQAELERRREELLNFPERTWLLAIIDDLSSDLRKKRPVARALKKVYASLWNDRAFEERAYFSIDHGMALMGVMVNPSFVLEGVDSVAVTNLFDAAEGASYTRLVSQIDGQPVVSPPDPSVTAEVLTFRHSPERGVDDVRVLVASSLSPSAIWSPDRLQELAQLLFVVQDHFQTHVYSTIDPLRLDLEIKRTQDDRIVIKQARPFVSSTP